MLFRSDVNNIVGVTGDGNAITLLQNGFAGKNIEMNLLGNTNTVTVNQQSTLNVDTIKIDSTSNGGTITINQCNSGGPC